MVRHEELEEEEQTDEDEADDERGKNMAGVPRELDAAPGECNQGKGRARDDDKVAAVDSYKSAGVKGEKR